MRNKTEIIWRHDLAYAVGLLATDGNLSSDGRHMVLVSKDIEQINTFKRCLGINNRISLKASGYTKTKKYYFVQFGNVNLYRWLQQIGLTPKKSKTISKLSIPDEYLSDYLRGYIDGDGSLSVFQDAVYPNSQRLYTRFFSGSLKHLKWLKSRIKSLFRVDGFIGKVSGAYELRYAKTASITLLNAIYYNKNIPCLQRKRKLIEQFLN
ncbi:hypothetical protein ACFL1I_02165 [Candidatus Omnitrophota bacterium]